MKKKKIDLTINLNIVRKFLEKHYKIRITDVNHSSYCSSITFKVKGIKNFQFGVWSCEGDITIFAQHKYYLNKFKPSNSSLNTVIKLESDGTFCPLYEVDLMSFVNAIKRNPLKARIYDNMNCFETIYCLGVNNRQCVASFFYDPIKYYYYEFKDNVWKVYKAKRDIKRLVRKYNIKDYMVEDLMEKYKGSWFSPRYKVLLYNEQDYEAISEEDSFNMMFEIYYVENKSERESKWI